MLQNESSWVLLESFRIRGPLMPPGRPPCDVNADAGKSIPAADRIAPVAVECNCASRRMAALLPRRIKTGNFACRQMNPPVSVPDELWVRSRFAAPRNL